MFKIPTLTPQAAKSFDDLVQEAITRIEEIWNKRCPDSVNDYFEHYISVTDIFGGENIPPMLRESQTRTLFWMTIRELLPVGFQLKLADRDAGWGCHLFYQPK